MIEAIHLFAGPGGLERGALDEGVGGTGIEWDANAVATRRAAGLATIHGDVRTYGPRDFPRATVLTGGPPCQTFTIAGSGSGRAELDRVIAAVKLMGAGDHVDPSMFADERTALILEPLRWAISDYEAGYNAIVLEQVPQALPVWNAYAEVLRGEGYSVATGILRTEQYGVPQTRKRAVLVARLVGEARLPEPTHRPYRKGVPQHEGDPGLKDTTKAPRKRGREEERRGDAISRSPRPASCGARSSASAWASRYLEPCSRPGRASGHDGAGRRCAWCPPPRMPGRTDPTSRHRCGSCDPASLSSSCRQRS